MDKEQAREIIDNTLGSVFADIKTIKRLVQTYFPEDTNVDKLDNALDVIDSIKISD